MKKLLQTSFFLICIALSSSSFGRTCTKVGNTIFCDDGSSSTQIGNTRFNSDGSSCTKIGDSVFCN